MRSLTPCLLTLGAIPATSADTPHCPGDTTAEGGLSGGAAKHSVVNTDTGSSTHAQTTAAVGMGGIFLPLKSFIFGEVTSVTTKLVEASPTLSLFLSLSLPLHDPNSAHMATRAGLGTARALARMGGATRTCKQRGVAQRHHSRSSGENKLA